MVFVIIVYVYFAKILLHLCNILPFGRYQNTSEQHLNVRRRIDGLYDDLQRYPKVAAIL